MHISKIELENIKSHAHASYDFSRGTTAITGENGAGKTTIIEAIAWVMFDLLDYKKEDFLRRGAKKGWARVTFESSIDEREYVVYRDTGAGYHVTDPRLDTRIADKKEEVIRFLWQHLGLEPGTDLRSLFKQAIGVPQGTFTAIFLDGAAERKVAFDRLLKVEEYRQAAEKLRETSRLLDSRVGEASVTIARAEGELLRSEAVEAEHKNQLELLGTLAADIEMLERTADEKRHVVDTLNEIERVENAAASVRAEQKRIADALQSIANAHSEIAALAPKAVEQDSLETTRSKLREGIAASRAVAEQANTLKQRVDRLRVSYKENSEQIKQAEASVSVAAKVEPLTQRDAELLKEIAGLNAALERDRKFQDEIRNGLCPILSEKCLNLKPGQTLETFISTQFEDVRSRITSAESERSAVTAELRISRDAERLASSLDTLRQREAELKAEGTRLADEQKAMEQQIGNLAQTEQILAETETKLQAFGDPRSRIRLLESEISREPELRASAAEIEKNLERLTADREILLERLEIEDLERSAGYTYDARRHATEKAALLEAEKGLAAARATHAATASRASQLEAELKRFSELRKSLAGDFKEKERLERVAEATAFIRDTLKEAAPRVARNYVYHVSLEANLMFREITGNAERTLKWGEDYAIMLEEDGYERPFQSFSGGEQMAAALSVRLGLLKQLTDIRIAFFDEPTTNMDAERRENLAMQISRITNFDQLFVISHDETFDSYVDNVLAVA